MIEEILSEENLKGAYLDLVEKFDKESKTFNYAGIDGLRLSDYDTNSAELLMQVRQELIELKPVNPTLEFYIPKNDGGKRIVYVYSVKDRLKAQAIFRVTEPYFEKNYSPYVFSYRASKPYHYAAKSIAKRYKKYLGQDTVFKSDVSDYFYSIEQDILEEKLKNIGFSEPVIEVLRLFMNNSVLRDKNITLLEKGVILGVPMICSFANLYLTDLDNEIGKQVSLYRRVGDDFIIFDKDHEKVLRMRDRLMEETAALGLTISEKKTEIIRSDQPFTFVGYKFDNGKIGIKDSTIRRAQIRWKRKLKYFPVSNEEKLKRLNQALFKDGDCIHNDFVQMIICYKQANDYDQIRNIYQSFLRILTKFFFGEYSQRNQRIVLKDILAKERVKLPSLYSYFIDIHNGRKTIAELSV
jgi:RNA-directed DNA polymerase